MPQDPAPMPYMDHLTTVAASDVTALQEAAKHYGDSWKRRGGVGAFMMAARKWDRLENRLANPPDNAIGEAPHDNPAFNKYDILEAIRTDQRSEGIIDDIRDLRRYLTLIEAEAIALGFCPAELGKNRDTPQTNISYNEDEDEAETREITITRNHIRVEKGWRGYTYDHAAATQEVDHSDTVTRRQSGAFRWSTLLSEAMEQALFGANGAGEVDEMDIAKALHAFFGTKELEFYWNADRLEVSHNQD